MHNFVGNAVNGTLHGWVLSGDWDNLLLFYGIIFLYIGYKFLKYLGEAAEELAESEEAREEEIENIIEWIIAFLPLTIVFVIAWYHYNG